MSPELHIIALVARAFGGMRTSDLHAWSWEQIDLGVRRGKTPEECELQTDTDQTRRVDLHS